jgi:predicted dehydrogenase
LIDVGVYPLQACRYLTGEEPIEASAFEIKTDPVKFAEVDETVSWMMKLPSGLTANCLTTYHFGGRDEFTAWGTKGRFGLRPCYGYRNVAGCTSDPEIPISFPQTNHFTTQMGAFSLAIIEARPFEIPDEERLRDLLVIEAIYRSIASGKKETVEQV